MADFARQPGGTVSSPASRHAIFDFAALEPRLLLHGGTSDAHPGLNLHLDTPADFLPVSRTLRQSTSTLAADVTATHPLSDLPALSSNRSATAQLYLDFDGDPATHWGSYDPTTTPAFDRDGDPTTFSDSELSAIRETWSRVAEKYSPFNINVTTVNPGTLTDYRSLRVVIGGNGLWAGDYYGGLAYVGGFSNSAPNTVYVFSRNLGNGTPKYVAEAAAHEAGHGFGLEHQSDYDAQGQFIDEYSPGNGVTAPVMGVSYDARGVWWNGPTLSPTTYQNDMAVIAGAANGFGYRPDDHGNSVFTASDFAVNGDSVSASGIISHMRDADYFTFTTGGGVASFTASVAKYGPTLDLKLVLKDSLGNTITFADTTSLGETLTTTLAAGTYSLGVLSEGRYGDAGQYTVRGSIAPAAPEPEPPAAPTRLTVTRTSKYGLHLAWLDNADNETGYRLQWSADGRRWYLLLRLPANTIGVNLSLFRVGANWFRVVARNAAGASAPSNIAYAATGTRIVSTSTTTQASALPTRTLFSQTPLRRTSDWFA